jgi:CMP-N,N'-diacetyllegionaminic acid synthase
MLILAIIPAKGNSVRLPKKNLRILAGYSLLEHTIRSSLTSRLVNRTIVSTDSDEIAKLSVTLGADVPFLRSKRILKKNTSNIDVIKYTLDTLDKKESYRPEIVLLLQPTSPLRTSKMIDSAINLLRNSNATSVISVKNTKINPDFLFVQTQYAKQFIKNRKIQTKKPVLYYPNGAIYAFWWRTLEKHNSIFGPKVKLMVMPEESSIDVDTMFDLFIAEMTIRYWSTYRSNSKHI